jgi:hypothetical protein
MAILQPIILVISKVLQILGFQPQISKVFLDHQNNFLTVGQNKIGNKIPFLFLHILRGGGGELPPARLLPSPILKEQSIPV